MRNLYPRLAATNLKKNRRFYLPYLLACIVIVALFCIMLTLASDPYLGQMQHGVCLKLLVRPGLPFLL